MGDVGRRYNEKEFALILRRATEMQDRPGVTAAERGGLTLAELSAIAREVGLDPALVVRAAGELDVERPSRLTRFLGGAAWHRAQASVPAALASEAYPVILDAIRSATGRHGDARESLGSLEWHAWDGLTHLNVTVTPDRGTARVVLSADRSSGQAATWLLSILTSFVAAGITGAIVEPSTVAGGIGLAAGVLSAGILTARTIWASATQRFEKRMESTMERLTPGLGAGLGAAEESDRS